jgi:hypothetical protein
LPSEIAQTKYPPVYPVFLSIILFFCNSQPDNIFYLQFSSAILSGLVISFSYLYLISQNHISRKNALLALTLLSSSHLFLYFGSVTMSEMLFSFILILSVYLFEKALSENSKKNYFTFYTSGFLFSLLVLCRSAGIFFIPCCILYLRKTKLKAFFFLCGFFTLFLPWTIWSSNQRSKIETNLEYAYYSGYLSWFDTVFPIYHKVIAFNLIEAVFIFPFAFFESFSVLFSVDNPFWILITFSGIILLYAWILNFKAKKFLVLSPILYLLALLIWPGPPLRMIVPLLPLLFPIMTEGLFSLFKKSRFDKYFSKFIYIFFAFGLFCNLAQIYNYKNLIEITKIPYLEFPEKSDQVKWQDYEEMFSWIKNNTQVNDIISSNLDPVINIYTGRKSIMPYKLEAARWIYHNGEPHLGSDEEIIDHLKKVNANYLAILPMPSDSSKKDLTELSEKLIKNYPKIFSISYQGNDSRFIIYKISN